MRRAGSLRTAIFEGDLVDPAVAPEFVEQGEDDLQRDGVVHASAVG